MAFDNNKRFSALAKDDFKNLTPEQRMRADTFMDHVREELLEPIWAEVEEVCPGYGDLQPIDKMVELLKLNEPHNFKGDSLLLDFYLDETHIRTNFYTGQDHLCKYVTVPGTNLRFYEPYFAPRTHSTTSFKSLRYFRTMFPDKFDSLPIPYRLLAVSQYIDENLLTKAGESWCYCARLVDSLEARRFSIATRENDLMEIIGYRFEIADTYPHDEMMEGLGQAGRNLYWFMSEKAAKTFDPYSRTEIDSLAFKQRRSTQDKTDFLVYFIEEYMPNKLKLYCPPLAKERGIKRNDPCYCSWDDVKAKYDLHASELVDSNVPQIYSSTKSLKNAYLQTRTRREKMLTPATPHQPGAGNNLSDSEH